MESELQAARSWTTRRDEKKRRLHLVSSWMNGPVLAQEKLVAALELLIAPGDRIVLEGDNQKQADFLSRSLVKADPGKLHHLHLVISSISRPEHLTLFELGIAKKVDFAFAGPQSLRVAQLLEDGVLEIGAIHTYVELYARLLVDLAPNVVLVCAEQADREGNLYTGPNTEDTPVIVEAAAFHDGIVIVQVNRIVDQLPRVDIPGSWGDVVVEADRPFAVEPLFTRDPRHITDLQILTGMMVIRGIYERHQVHSLNHGIGFDTAAIELLLPTYGESLGLRGKICEHWVLNPHPTMIPAIESGWVKSVHCFGSEVGMDGYIRARPDIFFTGRDGSLRSNRVLCQLAGQYAVDAFIGSTLQMDGDANSSTVTAGRLAGFGGAPNMGHDPHGRRHASHAWLDLKADTSPTTRGRKLVVQTVETFQKGGVPAFVEHWEQLPLFASQQRLPPETQAILHAQRQANRAIGLANSLRGMGAGQQQSLWSHLPQMKQPVQLIVGELDARYRQIGARMQSLVPRANFAVVPEAGHAVHLDQPARFVRLVESALVQPVNRR